MKEKKKTNLLIVILGPTAIGKTSLSISLAKEFHTEILSGDSRQFYREIKIGTSVPSEKELSEVRHHFIGNLSITDYYNVSKFENEALLILDRIFKINRYAVLVGGSGLYINAVCEGIDDLPDPDESLREDLKKLYESRGISILQEKLKELDPEYYNIVDLANPKRLLRALEVCFTTGKTFTLLRSNKPKLRDFKVVKIGLNRDRQELFDIINQRVDTMISNGLIEEAEQMFPNRGLNALNTVGYKELFEYFEDKITLNRAIEKVKTNSRRYAKRQLTWFKKDSDIHWFHPAEAEKVIAFINGYMK